MQINVLKTSQAKPIMQKAKQCSDDVGEDDIEDDMEAM